MTELFCFVRALEENVASCNKGAANINVLYMKARNGIVSAKRDLTHVFSRFQILEV